MEKHKEFTPFQILLFFVMFSFVMRFFSFFPSVIDHDESTYLVIAKEILKGKILYTDVTDIKPVGIFYIIAGYLKIFGDSVFGFRIFGAAIIAVTSFLLYKIKLKIGHSFNVAFTTGLIYIIFLSVWTYYGVSINTEHFFNLFTALALFVILGKRVHWNILVFGFIMGIGFLVKIVVIFDFIAIMMFLFITDVIHKDLSKRKIYLYVLSGCCFLLPFGIVNLSFYLTGHFHDFYQINYIAFRNYPMDKRWGKLLLWIAEFFVRFLPVSVFYFYSLFTRQRIRGIKINEKLLVIIWSLFCLVSITMAGKTFRHYTIQLMIPVTLMAGNIFNHHLVKPEFITFIFRKRTGYLLLGLLIICNLWMQKKDYYDKPDYPEEISAYLKPKLNKGDIIYTGNGQQIIYFLLNISPPAKYVHRSLLFEEVHYNALEIDPKEEFIKIFNKKPRFIFEGNGKKNDVLTNELKKNYFILKYFSESMVTVYERKR